MLFVNNDELLTLLRQRYVLADIKRIGDFLCANNVLRFPQIGTTGLFPASAPTRLTKEINYDFVWVRDNIHVANAHRIVGEVDLARSTLRSLFSMFMAQRERFECYIAGDYERRDYSMRPCIRFRTEDAVNFEFPPWNHQNDALGYFLWFACRMIFEGQYKPTTSEIGMLGTFVRFFEAIEYWSDEDSGHWEEAPKIEASSIGPVLAGLIQYLRCLKRFDSSWGPVCKGRALRIFKAGCSVLEAILPAECVQEGKRRDYDSALLFLIFPLGLLDYEGARRIVGRVERNLVGDYGVKRYLGDLFWGPNYDMIVPLEQQTFDTTQNPGAREGAIKVSRGVDEAQWCIFDSILSVIYGTWYRSNPNTKEHFLMKQTYYFNRALGQISGIDEGKASYKCPELYYRKTSRYTYNTSIPLLWTQGNLLIALRGMEGSLLVQDRVHNIRH